jgi:hypothetical protein
LLATNLIFLVSTGGAAQLERTTILAHKRRELHYVPWSNSKKRFMRRDHTIGYGY